MTRSKPTVLEIDASAVTSGVNMECVSRASRFLSARLAMFRSWIADRTLTLLKTSTRDMRADIPSEPVNPKPHIEAKVRLLLTGQSMDVPSLQSPLVSDEQRGGESGSHQATRRGRGFCLWGRGGTYRQKGVYWELRQRSLQAGK